MVENEGSREICKEGNGDSLPKGKGNNKKKKKFSNTCTPHLEKQSVLTKYLIRTCQFVHLRLCSMRSFLGDHMASP